MKTKEELDALKNEVKDLNAKLAELSEDELKAITGGAGILIPEGATLEVNGDTEPAPSDGGGGILVPQESTLIVVGDGKWKG